MKLKVCGMMDPNQLRSLQDLRVNYAGLIFYENSKRCVGDKSQNHKSEIRDIQIKKVGVFVNADIETIKNKVEEYNLSLVQLHGDEGPEFCEQVQELVPVIKAIRINDEMDLEGELNKYENACDYFLFDTYSKQYGGSGKKFDWDILQTASISKPFFLSGGIGSGDAEAVKIFSHPLLYAIDINSRFEISPGVKDLEMVKSFIGNFK